MMVRRSLLSALILAFAYTSTQALAQIATSDDCPVVSNSPGQLVLRCGGDDALLVLALPDLAAGGYDGTLTQGDYTTTLVWLTEFGGVTHSPVWRYLAADGLSACQLDGRPSPSGAIVRTCMSLDVAGL